MTSDMKWFKKWFQRPTPQLLASKHRYYLTRPVIVRATFWESLVDGLEQYVIPNTSGDSKCQCGEVIHDHGVLNGQVVCPGSYIVNESYALKPDQFHGTFEEVVRIQEVPRET